MDVNAGEQTTLMTSQILAKTFWVLTLLSLIVSAWIFVSWLYKPGNFPFLKIELVNRLENQKSHELQLVATKAINGGFFLLDVDTFRVELMSKLPWIKNVSVRKVWPNKLKLSIAEHKPVVRWISVNREIKKKLDEFQLLTNEGFIFHPKLTAKQKKKFSKLILLSGPKSSSENVLKICTQINENLEQLGVAINQCNLNERRSWVIILENNLTIKLGKEKIMWKLQRFIDTFSGQLKRYITSIDYVDLRYSNGFSIKWIAGITNYNENRVNKALVK